jgi:hypothetical protein
MAANGKTSTRPACRQDGVGRRAGLTIRYVRTRKVWRLFWRRADLKWHGYEPLAESARLDALVREIDNDPFCCFFG